MGFDIYGVKAKNDKGEYFRNNVWWWRPLWDYVTKIGLEEKILTPKDCEKGFFNDGEKISEAKAEKLAIALTKSIKDGRAKKRNDAIKEEAKRIKEANKGLNFGDKGYQWGGDYPFSITNLKEFITFIKNSGGFQIC